MDVSALKTRVYERLDEDPSAPVYYTAAEVLNALNKSQRCFAFLTHCIERVKTFELTADQTFYTITDDTDFSDFLLPLRVTTNGLRILPKTIHQLDAKSSRWRATAGTPTNYGMLGLYQLFTFPQYDSAGKTLSITCACEPVALSGNSDVPEIPTEFHQLLPDFAIWWLRVKEGGTELQKSLEYLKRFLDGATAHADTVRARARAQKFDSEPFDIRSIDISGLYKMSLKTERMAKMQEGKAK